MDGAARTDRIRRAPGGVGSHAARNAARGTFAAALLAALSLSPARAGQVRVDVGSGGQNFAPYAVNINQGDHVVWVWVAGAHTVTNWTLPADSLNVLFGGTIFDSDAGGGHFGQNTTTRFSWKSDRTGHVPYVCAPHIPDMSGRIIISPLTDPPTIAVSDFRLTEVQFNVPGGQDMIEITNLGSAQGNLGRYRLAIGGAIEFNFNNFVVPSGGRVVVHMNQSGANAYPNIFVPGVSLPDDAGSVGLYVPSTISAQNALTNANLMIDFVQWGAPGQANETTAGIAGLWTPGTSINGVAAGHSIEYCANATLDHGIARWAEISPPNPGGNSDCTTPVLSETWGHLKVIYRR